tara:strand:- start:286 stop:462 length:177 start_codon:yes stop_codon:yes gene_type:complete
MMPKIKILGLELNKNFSLHLKPDFKRPDHTNGQETVSHHHKVNIIAVLELQMLWVEKL